LPLARSISLPLTAALSIAACSFPDVTFTADAGRQLKDATVTFEAAPPDVPDADSDSFVTSGDDAASTDGSAQMTADADGGAVEDGGYEAQLDGAVTDATSKEPNCDCGAGSMYPTNFAGCGLLGLGLLCAQSAGFPGPDIPTPCGDAADFVTCTPNGLVCGATHTLRVQQCQ